MTDRAGWSGADRRPWLGSSRQATIARGLQALVLGAVVLGMARGNVDLAVNALGGLAVTFVPALLERNAGVSIDPRLALWLTAAVALHVVGAVGLPGVPGTLYTELPWWDNLTHVASASLVAGMGYVSLRGLDEHTDAVDLPPGQLVVFTVLFVLAFGVYWELFEYAVGHVRIGGESALTQYGVQDTLGDLAFDAAGGLLVAVLAGAYRLRTDVGAG